MKPLEDIDDPAMIRTRYFMIIWLCMALLLRIPGNLLGKKLQKNSFLFLIPKLHFIVSIGTDTGILKEKRYSVNSHKYFV